MKLKAGNRIIYTGDIQCINGKLGTVEQLSDTHAHVKIDGDYIGKWAIPYENLQVVIPEWKLILIDIASAIAASVIFFGLIWMVLTWRRV